MNERIKELATLATRQYSPTYYTQEWIQGFAQLIVRECLSYMNDADGDIDYVKFMINRNFGVEE
jgi:hypothetical protein